VTHRGPCQPRPFCDSVKSTSNKADQGNTRAWGTHSAPPSRLDTRLPSARFPHHTTSTTAGHPAPHAGRARDAVLRGQRGAVPPGAVPADTVLLPGVGRQSPLLGFDPLPATVPKPNTQGGSGRSYIFSPLLFSVFLTLYPDSMPTPEDVQSLSSSRGSSKHRIPNRATDLTTTSRTTTCCLNYRYLNGYNLQIRSTKFNEKFSLLTRSFV